jgi:hypothetical protein
LRLLRLLAGIDCTAFEKIYFITTTYPDVCPDVYTCKAHLKAFRKRLTRKFGDFPAVWRLGIQTRGFWHFHILVFAPRSFGSLKELREFIACSWYEVTGRINEGHLHAGTNVELIRTRKSLNYVGRYMSKEESFPETVQTGKIWNVWNKKLLPIRWETQKVSLEDAYQVRRVFRRLQRKKGTGSLRTVQVFLRHENLVRLLAFLRDDKEHPKGARRPLPSRKPIAPTNAWPGRSSRVSRTSGSTRNEEN